MDSSIERCVLSVQSRGKYFLFFVLETRSVGGNDAFIRVARAISEIPKNQEYVLSLYSPRAVQMAIVSLANNFPFVRGKKES